MDKVPDRIKEQILQFFYTLKEEKVSVTDAYLFGSYTKGTADNDSDIDIALISELFTGDRMKDREIIRKSVIHSSPLIEIIPFAVSDFTDDNPLAREIRRNGIRLSVI